MKPYRGNNGMGEFYWNNYRFYWFNSFFGTPIRLSIDGGTNKKNETTPYFKTQKIGTLTALTNFYISMRKQTMLYHFAVFNNFAGPYSCITKLNQTEI
jgi:hypothetical protein